MESRYIFYLVGLGLVAVGSSSDAGILTVMVGFFYWQVVCLARGGFLAIHTWVSAVRWLMTMSHTGTIPF